jgi:hypothetical protein
MSEERKRIITLIENAEETADSMDMDHPIGLMLRQLAVAASGQLAENAKLREIVEKLPKFANGDTIHFDNDVWAIMRPFGARAWVTRAGKAKHLRVNGVDCDGGTGGWQFVQCADAYPSLEAANAVVSVSPSPCPTCGRASASAAIAGQGEK